MGDVASDATGMLSGGYDLDRGMESDASASNGVKKTTSVARIICLCQCSAGPCRTMKQIK